VLTVHGFFFTDQSGDGVFNTSDGDLPLANVSVMLSTEAGLLIQEVQSGLGGYYTFHDIDSSVAPAGSIVVLTVDLGETSTYLASAVGVDSDFVLEDDNQTIVGAVELSGGCDILISGGLWPYVRIESFIWEDVNNAGCRDELEPGVGGVQVLLLESLTDQVVAITATDELGFFQFTSLQGVRTDTLYTCRILFDQDTLVSFLPTSTNAVCDAAGKRSAPHMLDSDGTYNMLENSLDVFMELLSPGEVVTALADFGVRRRVELNVEVFDDRNCNGLFDSAESLLSDVPVALVAEHSAIIASGATGGTGYLMFNEQDVAELGVGTVNVSVVIDGLVLAQLRRRLSPGMADSDASYGNEYDCAPLGANCAVVLDVVDGTDSPDLYVSIGTCPHLSQQRASDDDDDDDDDDSSSTSSHHHHHHEHAHMHVHRLCRLREVDDRHLEHDRHKYMHHHSVAHDVRHRDWHNEHLPYCDDDDPKVVFEEYEHGHIHGHESPIN
jgi:hypothetical protein